MWHNFHVSMTEWLIEVMWNENYICINYPADVSDFNWIFLVWSMMCPLTNFKCFLKGSPFPFWCVCACVIQHICFCVIHEMWKQHVSVCYFKQCFVLLLLYTENELRITEKHSYQNAMNVRMLCCCWAFLYHCYFPNNSWTNLDYEHKEAVSYISFAFSVQHKFWWALWLSCWNVWVKQK